MVREVTVTTVTGFLRRVAEVCTAWNPEKEAEWIPWFRGEDNADWASFLRPKLYRRDVLRETQRKEILHHDQELRLEFRRRGMQLTMGQSPANKWEWYFLMQHYGVPTRLLDWTDGALVALHFAVKFRGGRQDRQGNADAAVYILDPWWLNDRAFRKLKDPPVGVALPDWPEVKKFLPHELNSESLRPTIPVAIDPTYVSARLAAQRSRFTIFGKVPDGLVSAAGVRGSHLFRIRIRKQAISQIQKDLARCGISESTIFPDLEGLGRELSYWWEEQCRDKFEST